MFNLWQESNHKILIALAFVVKKLEAEHVRYQVTGSVAGNIHGSSWTPDDIDIEVGAKDFDRVAHIFAPYVVRAPYHHIDCEFDLWLMTLSVSEVQIDVNQVEEAYAFTKDGVRVPFLTDLRDAERRCFFHIETWVQPLEDLIAYKRLIGRDADVLDLSSLQSRFEDNP